MKCSFLIGIVFSVITVHGFAQTADVANEIRQLRSTLRANPEDIPSALETIEKRISLLSSDEDKGGLFIKAADAFASVNIRLTASQVLQLTQDGFAFPLGMDDSIKAYTLEAGAIEVLNRKDSHLDKIKRRQVAELQLKAIAIIMESEKTITLKDLPKGTVGVLNFGDDGNSEWKQWKKELEEKRDKETALFLATRHHNTLVLYCQDIMNSLAHSYSDSDADDKELRTIAGPILKDQDFMRQLFEYVSSHRPKKPPVLDKIIDDQLREDFTAFVEQELSMSDHAKEFIAQHLVFRLIESEASVLTFTEAEMHSLRTGEPLYKNEEAKAAALKLPAPTGQPAKEYSNANELRHDRPMPAILDYYKKVYAGGQMNVIQQAIFVKLTLANAAKTDK